MFWESELERLKRYLRRKIEDLFQELEKERTPEVSGESEAELEEPLHTFYELPEKYVVVCDIPACDETKIEVLGYTRALEIKARLKREVKLEQIGFRCASRSLKEYKKRVSLPEDADVARILYTIRAGRLIIEIPKKNRSVF
uniref:Hsp20/alpha crystallin family protein n=1 Tax=Fervidicoccus fontis TaxID=683846 RepID=A0A7J3ZLK0_9CREN